MSIHADQEKGFYDQRYSQHLSAEDHALAVSVPILTSQFNDPASPLFERRRLFTRALDCLLSEPLTQRRMLDYGCGVGDWGVALATEGAEVTLLDLSPVAIELGLRKARASGVAERVRGVARDANDLSCFGDGEFELIYAGHAVHHTMKYPQALSELIRVLRPGGKLVLAEGYGNNLLLNASRRFRWWWSREPDEAGEGLIFDEKDVKTLRRYLRQVDVEPLSLFAMAKRILRGNFHRSWARLVLRGFEALDSAVLTVLPFLKRYCGEAVVIGIK